MKIAILIPCYNVEKFLAECLDSVLAAAVPGMEVFCCNDGSTDGTLRVLEDYSAKHPEVHYTSQLNAGVSTTRNRLLDGIPPEFDAFAFVDADDTVEPMIYAALSVALERTGADVAECEWSGPERVIEDRSLFLLKRTAPGEWIALFNKLYRRSSVGHVRLRENLAHEEDFYYCFEVNQVCRRKVLVPIHGYNYRNNPDGVCNRLNLRKYVTSACERVRLSVVEWLESGRIPERLRGKFKAELAADVFRMCIRKNLKKNRDLALRRELFIYAADFLDRLCVGHPTVISANVGLIPRLFIMLCRKRYYRLSSVLIMFT